MKRKRVAKRTKPYRNSKGQIVIPAGYRTPTASLRKGYSVVPRTTGAMGMGPEMKYYDAFAGASSIANLTGGTPSFAGSNFTNVYDPFHTLFCPKQGAGINERVGRKVAIHTMRMRITVIMDVFSDSETGPNLVLPPAPMHYRYLLVQDTQTNSLAFDGTDVLAPTLQSGTLNDPSAYLMCHQNLSSLGRFIVRKDKHFYMQVSDLANQTPVSVTNDAFTNTNTSQSSAQARTHKINLKFSPPIIVHFNGANGGDLGDIIDNSFALVIASASISNGQARPLEANYICRTGYTDV